MQTIIGTDVQAAAQILQQGQLVAIPTETVYGLAANALDEKAVVQIFDAKNRPRFNPLIMHVGSISAISQYAIMNDLAQKLAHAFMPGAFTLLLPKLPVVPDLVTAGSPKVAVRMPNHALTLALLQQLPFPLAAPSANVFGYVSPTTAQHVYDGLSGRIPYILDGGACTVGVESTIVEVVADAVVVHRVGGVNIEAIEALIGKKVQLPATTVHKPVTSGQLKSHYATTTPLIRGDVKALLAEFADKKVAIIGLNTYYEGLPKAQQYLLSVDGNLTEAAQHLFNVMRQLDGKGYDVIIAEVFPDEGLGKAINDRLERAQVLHK
ncbi:L-threonylcarbamoyladenylate synthase [Parasediminibacterium paludis]|uniref:Threonylcarbamoyl-AMP synthase n=1 Tax=Parasediminibacterium paludis TaxID=908966 RepID=A0ABV8PXG3_9BACT